MQKILFTTCLVLCLAGSAFGQRHKVSVSFFKDGKKVVLKDDFKIYIVLQDSLKTTVIKPVVKNNSFFIPNFEEGQKGSVIFRHKKYLIRFYHSLYIKQNISYHFMVDYKPFDKEYIWGENLQGVKYFYYAKWPLSKSYGIHPVKHPKKYRRKILKLIE
ncbi:hypothetical protein [uncultured Microscilla sp.]|uniref:hypothetical protein n=1 Tax=uncultured Microscilla sp. TaxID=432653 RepID=UPI00262A25A0|nr:hypothetical protein [uncultured Microscilla sp.]